ncbi:velvet factor-domain-containing protein [Cyathus striatus]|nr:velvet factor-domain-containing protein [Cyathus striatus]
MMNIHHHHHHHSPTPNAASYHHQPSEYYHYSHPHDSPTAPPPHPSPDHANRTHNHSPAHGTDLIGRPIYFASGQFAGQTMRAELTEIQKADLGRKYARVDRRPLDPPPVVLLKLYHVYYPGTEQEVEKEVKNYDEVQVLGLVCTVDLFPVPGPGHPNPENPAAGRSHTSSPSNSTFSTTSSGYTFVHQPIMYPMPDISPPPTATQGYLVTSQTAQDIVHHVGEYPVTESSKMTPALVGATFIQPSCVEHQGKKSLVFVFADLAVKTEGTFILRYRVFDIFSRPYSERDDLAIQAECYGGSFRVYSTKEFPGLQASTELTKHLARWGVRLNIRETERRRRKKSEMGSASPARGAKRKQPGASPESGGESEDE